MVFTKWSEIQPSSKRNLRPDLGIREWGKLSKQEKDSILLHFLNDGWFGTDGDTFSAVSEFAEDHKARFFCNHLLAHGGPHYFETNSYKSLKQCCPQNAQQDLHYIFLTEHQDVVYELISYYAENLSPQEYKRFVVEFNDIFDQFGLNVLINTNGFILRQDPQIVKDIYEPTLKLLADKRWEPVGRELDDAFNNYLKNTPQDFSSSITHAVAGVQAFLQILINNETGEGDIAGLLKEALKNNLIPNDKFSEKIFKDLVSILMAERQAKGDPHPKEEYANEKTARLLLNLVMVFIQHCLQE
ncbi:MAG: hypothetical protein WC794_04865 [Candidatus Doudnabacteria bacterium]|jgi:hypothetical protein